MDVVDGEIVHSPPDYDDIHKLMNELFEFFNNNDKKQFTHPIIKGCIIHFMVGYIHPFVDGNGRIGRVLNNYLLIREGYVPINIKFIDRAQYYDAFKEFDEKRNSLIMEEIVGKAITNSFHKRLAYLNNLEIITLNEYATRKNTSHSNLINKAKRQTIEAFLEKGIWKIGLIQ